MRLSLSLFCASLCAVQQAQAELRNVFAHYMVGGMSGIDQAVTDVTGAKTLGIDAFALNVQNVADSWSTNAIGWLFKAAEEKGFHLFFSFDVAVLSDVSEFLPLFKKYQSSSAYYHHDSKPFVSTFDGGKLTFGQASPNAGWQSKFKDVLKSDGITPFFVPDFDDYGGSYDASFFNTYSVVDGVMNWESAWPTEGDGKVAANSAIDKSSMSAAHAAGKVYMMPLSSFQSKHLKAGQNWYRRGELTLTQRMTQALELGPDFIELLTWNDAGEGHYFGNVWNDSISSNQPIVDVTEGFDHTAWQSIIAPFITAYKAKATTASAITPFGDFAGSIWYRTLLTTASCSGDSLGKPSGAQNAEDVVNVAVLLPKGTTGTQVKVYSGGSLLKTLDGVAGLNAWSVTGLKTGAVRVELIKGGKVIGAASGGKEVKADASLCNYNYEVVKIA
ncbi:glycoside hydrolase family 71 protein [Aplosporella prunicola CBS 121167]|uniref:Glycoside hydrolase family 71 protein n=1 Tax=Aplosporella prunicola CBS 121167 TaxID=1176127 RepID=A0A6A6AXB1_9PEZI|nr:glycoside hydrolase family 71 protein [Aplosporella prunicola CBS 121167]KAF2136390.1 glycoside hydrolase family 71 protein [Aplosporella prunicola CBS 121167]